MAQSNEQEGEISYGEFARFLEASRNGESAMIKATNMNVTLYNQQAVDELLAIDRKQHELEARINELEETVFKPMAGKTWLDVRPDIELRRQRSRYDELKQELEKL